MSTVVSDERSVSLGVGNPMLTIHVPYGSAMAFQEAYSALVLFAVIRSRQKIFHAITERRIPAHDRLETSLEDYGKRVDQ